MILLLLIGIKFFYFYNKVGIQKNYIYTVILSTLGLTTLLRFLYVISILKSFNWWLTIYFIASIIMFIDVIYFSHFNQLTTINLIKQIRHLSTVGDSLLVLIEPSMLILIFDLVILPFLPKKIHHLLLSGLDYRVMLLYMALFILGLLYFKKVREISKQELFLYHSKDLFESLTGVERVILKRKVSPSELKNKRYISNKDNKLFGVSKDKNIIIIQVEALQNIMLFNKYKGVELTKNLNNFAKESLYFPRFFQSIGRGNTSDAEFTVLNSVYPSYKAPTFMEFTNRKYYALPNYLKDEGYKTFVFHGNQKHYYNRDKMYPKLGFSKYYGEEDFTYDKENKIGFGINDIDFLTQTADYLKKESINNKIFSFVITLSSHTPFNMPRKYVDIELDKSEEKTMLGRYIEAIHYTDKALGIFFDKLRKNGLMDTSTIILYGDHFAISASHGEDAMAASQVFSLNHGYGYDHMMNIPLIIHDKNIEPEVINHIGSQIDLYPTILNLLGAKSTKSHVFGHDIINNSDNIAIPPGYVNHGSFINDEVFFEASIDGNIENCKARTLFDHKPKKATEYKKEYDYVLNELALSRYALINNLIYQREENK